jgi:site-specific DNA-methyltransferase (adenine-specific)
MSSRKDDAGRWEVRHQDCLIGVQELPASSIDAVITDPPYGINFQDQAWDRPHIQPGQRSHDPVGRRYQQWCEQWARECLRILKPGGHIATFGAPRTAHRLASALEDSGLELRDTLLWLHGQGYPKSRNLAGEWAGWGTGLKPAYEPILLARRPLDGTVADNAARHRTGVLHIDACRTDGHRWPPNLLLDHHQDCREQTCVEGCPIGELGPRARFFYSPKPNRRERDAGCDQLPRRTIQTFKIGRDDELRAERTGTLNIHPTVKPLELMRWLIRLLAPAGAVVLDPFTGSGTTGVAAVLEDTRFLGFERDEQYIQIAQARIKHHSEPVPPTRPRPSTPRRGTTPHPGLSAPGQRQRKGSRA